MKKLLSYLTVFALGISFGASISVIRGVIDRISCGIIRVGTRGIYRVFATQ